MAERYPISTTTLPNGLRVVVTPDHAVPMVSINLWVDVGSRHEQPGRTGLAHLFEHLMFQGSQHVAEGEYLAALMANGGRVNATTWFDRTNYFATVPTGATELALWLEADRQGRLLPALTQRNLDNQREVVIEEKRQRYDNQPYGSVLADLTELLYPTAHPYHHWPIGAMPDVEGASLESVHEFYRTHYGPDNTVLTLAGDVEVDHGFAIAERHFGDLQPTGRGRPTLGPTLAPVQGNPRVDHVQQVPRDRVYLAFRLPAAPHPQLTAAAIALDALAGLTISRLNRRLVREAEVCTAVSASAMGLVDGASIGYLGADVSPDASAAEVEELICAELDTMAGDGPSDLEMVASLADTERHWWETVASLEERADLVSRYTLLHDDPERINTYLDRVRAVDADDVRAVLGEWMRPHHRATITYRSPEPMLAHESAAS